MTGLDRLVADNPELYRGLYRIGEPRRPSVTFQIENVETMRRDGFPLMERHYDEIAQFKEVQKLDPDWEAYERMEVAGKLWVMTAREGAQLIGYIVMFINYDPHYRTLLRATEDIHFIVPEHRKGLLGYRMLAEMKKAMQAKGVNTITLRTKANSDHGLLFERLGGILHDKVYTIVL
jgi:hypothetical protein